MITARAYDIHVEQLFDRLRRIHAALDAAGIPYRVIGGVGIFLQITERDPDLARMTRDLDLAIHRSDLAPIIAAAASAGFRYRHAAGVDMLLDVSNPKGVAIHLLFAHERVEPSYSEPTPFSAPTVTSDGYLIAPVGDLVRMKLTSFRLKDKVHVQDMDGAGLITPEIEASLSQPLRERLREVRATR
jgi:hypothetical protein